MDMMYMPAVQQMMKMELQKMDEAVDLSDTTMKDFCRTTICIIVT